MKHKASFVHFEVKLVKKPLREVIPKLNVIVGLGICLNESFDYQSFLIIIDELLLICSFIVMLAVE